MFIYHSKDDAVVDIKEFEKYKKALPKAMFRLFQKEGHFNGNSIPKLVEDIKSL